VDLVLGADPASREDFVIEVNPRLTTSYVGLRAACRENLAQAWLDVARGGQPVFSFASAALEFSADGTIAAMQPEDLRLC
jgi:predicted ATP-grasp superfamily ATP-dependent carboligase